MNDMNIVTVSGRLVREPELKHVGSTSVCKFAIAVDDSYKNKSEEKIDRAYFFDCQVWAGFGEWIASNVPKGTFVNVTGKLTQNTWTDDSGKKQSRVVIDVDYFRILKKPGD